MFERVQLKLERMIREFRVRKCEVPFVVWFRERSGSTHLCHMLNCHPDIMCRQEDFNAVLVDPQNPSPAGCQPRPYQQAQFFRRIHNFSGEEFDDPSRKQIVGHLHNIFAASHKACGMKFKFPIQFDLYPEVVQELKELSRPLRVIMLYRRNLLKQAVSRANMLRIKARFEGCSNVLQYDPSAGPAVEKKFHEPFEIDVSKTIAYAKRLKSDESRFRQSIEAVSPPGRDLPLMSVYYEDLLKDHDATVRQVFEFLDVDPAAPVIQISRKATPNDLSQVIANFGELESLVRGTEFEPMLYE